MADRVALGKAARAAVPRSSHAVFDPPAARPGPVALLEEQGRSRVPELVPIRYGRMLGSPFSYFRGAALPMAADLATTPVSGLTVQACGDAHLSNFGMYASPERKLLFDVNDFDETLPGPWEWDVKRLAASLEVAARDNGFGRKDRRQIVLAAAGRYRAAMRQLAGMNNLDTWYVNVDVQEFQRQFADEMNARQRQAIETATEKARAHDSKQALAKLCTQQNGQLRIVGDPPLVVPIMDLVPKDLDRAGMETELHGLRDWKFSFPIEAMVPEGLRMYAAVCGGTLARAHARSGDRIAIAAYLGNSDVFDRAIADFASAYADQNERDYNALAEAAASRRVTAERGV